MTRKWFVLAISLICIMIALAGCSGTSEDAEPTPTSFLDFLHAAIPSGVPTVHELDNSTLSEEEYHLRRVINSVSMYHEVTGQEYKIEIDEEKYGIEDFSRHDDWYSFNDIEDMATVFGNADFQRDFYDLYGYKLGIKAYYLPLASLIEKYNADICSLNLIAWDDDYNLSYDVSGYRDQSFISYDIFYTSSSVDLKALMEFYADVDDQELSSATTTSGALVYTMSTNEGSVFFEDIGFRTDDTVTAYIWQQDNVIGVLVLPGEFSEENLDLCVLEKHEI